MTEPRPTRRELMGAAAAASLFGPAAGAAAAIAVPPSVFSAQIGSLAGSSGELVPRWPFVLAGVRWSSPRGARIELRSRSPRGDWSPWAPASTLGHEPDGEAERGLMFGQPVWFGASSGFQVRTSEPVRGLSVHFVGGAHTADVEPDVAGTTYPLAEPILDAGPGQPPIIARAAWAGAHGAHSPPAVPPGYGTVKLAFVHHTDNPNGYGAGAVPAILLAIYDFHRFVRGWHDIGYNFLIDAFGRIWEGRKGGIDGAVIGAQAGGYNEVSTGVAVLGTFVSAVPSSNAIAALERLLAWKLSLHGVPTLGHVTVRVNPADAFYTPFAPGAHVSLPRVAGHRDGDSTDCPGNAFYAKLPSIRPRIAALAGIAARSTIAGPATAVAGVPIAVSGRLAMLGGAAIVGTEIELQALARGGAQTVASASTGSDGSWQASLTLTDNARLRSLHATAPASVSDLIDVGVAPVVTLVVSSASPLRFGGTVSPAKRRVIVSLYAVEGQHRRRVASRRLTARDGNFAGGIKSPGHGAFVLVARTEADAHNIAGSSAPNAISL